MEVNFFWKGNDFKFFHYICILSHVKVGHIPVIWISGNCDNIYMKKLKLNDKVIIKDADIVFDVNDFLKNKNSNIRTASDLWRYHFLYNYGGAYCDTDEYAIKKFPSDEKWIVITGTEPDNNMISNCVIKAPKGEQIFKTCIERIKPEWGNVKIFSDLYLKIYGNSVPKSNFKKYSPYNFREWKKILDDVDIPDCNGIHLYGFMIENHYRNGKIDENFNKPSLLLKLIDNVRELL